jgi:hypothetical protein
LFIEVPYYSPMAGQHISAQPGSNSSRKLQLPRKN